MRIPFVKMHGIGNDYVYVEAFSRRIDDPPALARAIADRHFGVGGDGLILILPPEPGVAADVRMRMFNADGSESEMCGNGIRCVCKFAIDRGISTANPLRVQTGAGVLSLRHAGGPHGVERVTVDMGRPSFDTGSIPAVASRLRVDPSRRTVGVDVDGKVHDVCLVSVGNPHAVAFVPDVRAVDLASLGPRFEHHAAFPQRINLHVASVVTRREVVMRTWERGSGITLACGTGASAVCAAAALLGVTDRDIVAHLPGGDLSLSWCERTDHVFMTGPATTVFEGVYDPSSAPQSASTQQAAQAPGARHERVTARPPT